MEKKSHVNSVEKKRVKRAVWNKAIAEGDLQHLMSVHEIKFARGRVRMRARQDIQNLLSGEKIEVAKRHMKRLNDQEK